MPEIEELTLRIWRSRIREVLNRIWDPIGGCPEDEYDAYADKIATMICYNASDDELLAYLKWAEVENMGLGPSSRFNRSHGLKVVTALRELGLPLLK